jgi:hypothetical protein
MREARAAAVRRPCFPVDHGQRVALSRPIEHRWSPPNWDLPCMRRRYTKVTKATPARARASVVPYNADTKQARNSRGQRPPPYTRFMAMSV